MKKETQPAKGNILLDIIKSVFGATTVSALILVAIAVWLQVWAMTNPQPGMEYMFLGYMPFFYIASAFLLVRGIALLIRVVRHRDSSKVYRIGVASMGIIFLLPAGYILYGYASYYFVQYNAERISSNNEVLQLVEECKITTIRREYVSWDKPANQRQSTAAAYLKESAKSDAEKNSYFYGYRSFDPEYYDELAKAVNDTQPNCGKVELYDEHREDIPITYTWVDKEEALTALEACKIRDVFTVESPSEGAVQQAGNNKSATANIFMIMDPISEGFAGKLFLRDADQDTRTSILDFAKTKKGFCRYKQPNIDGME